MPSSDDEIRGMATASSIVGTYSYHESEDNGGQNDEGDLKQLTSNLLPLGKVVLGPAILIHNNLVILERRPVDLDLVDASYHPAHTEINLLDFPILEEDGAPNASQDGIGERVLGEKQPSENTSDGGKRQKGEVGLDKGKIKRNLGPV
ncbi:hypothetical protein E5D57_001403 [Metarhizium anisopliae]|nr:hypothetical protein E5D57_001403 [Metarhizium anisopliae]